MATAMVPELTLGERLAIARNRAGMSQQAIAEVLGVSRPLVSQWEKDHAPGPRLTHIRHWAEATGFDYGWLAGTVSSTYAWQSSLLLDDMTPAYDFTVSPSGIHVLPLARSA
jgi:transcriptional regulator with XRE-family HTH domain